MEILKAYRFRIYPTRQQKIILENHFGSTRYIYNYFLGKCKNADKRYSSYQTLCRELTLLKKDEYHTWLNDVSTHTLQQSLKDLNEAYVYFFRKLSDYPKFKKKSENNSFRSLIDVQLKDDKLYIQQFRKDNGIKIKQHRKIEGEIRYCTITKTRSGKYFASIVCLETEYKSWFKTGLIVGIDTGVENLATLSNGEIYENKKYLKTKSTKIDFLQKQLSKKEIGSLNFKRIKQKISSNHEKVVNRRKDYLHKTTTDIIKKNDVICIEDLDLSSLYKTHSIARSLGDASIGKFYEMLKYKAAWNDKKIIKIDRFYPTSKICNICGSKNENLSLKTREWTCSKCQTTHNRDLNAAINILRKGLEINQ